MPSSFAGENRLEQVDLSIALVDMGADQGAASARQCRKRQYAIGSKTSPLR
jgi:hypothetical protein